MYPMRVLKQCPSFKKSSSLTADGDAFEESSSSPIDSMLGRLGALVAVTFLGTTL